jgi:hypothetical protein
MRLGELSDDICNRLAPENVVDLPTNLSANISAVLPTETSTTVAELVQCLHNRAQ